MHSMLTRDRRTIEAAKPKYEPAIPECVSEAVSGHQANEALEKLPHFH
jgi:hypothetical protein